MRATKPIRFKPDSDGLGRFNRRRGLKVAMGRLDTEDMQMYGKNAWNFCMNFAIAQTFVIDFHYLMVRTTRNVNA